MPPLAPAYWSAEAILTEVGDVVFGMICRGTLSAPAGIVLRVLLARRFGVPPVVDLTPGDGGEEPILLTLAT